MHAGARCTQAGAAQLRTPPTFSGGALKFHVLAASGDSRWYSRSSASVDSSSSALTARWPVADLTCAGTGARARFHVLCAGSRALRAHACSHAHSMQALLNGHMRRRKAALHSTLVPLLL